MSKLPSLTPEKVIKLLEKNGFVLGRIRGSHHIYYNPETRKRAIVPLHKKSLPKGTMFEILKQAGINREELKEI